MKKQSLEKKNHKFIAWCKKVVCPKQTQGRCFLTYLPCSNGNAHFYLSYIIIQLRAIDNSISSYPLLISFHPLIKLASSISFIPPVYNLSKPISTFTQSPPIFQQNWLYLQCSIAKYAKDFLSEKSSFFLKRYFSKKPCWNSIYNLEN